MRYVERGGGRLHYNRRLRAIAHDGRAVTALDIAGSEATFAPGDVAVLAVTPQVCTQLLPEISAPLETRPIVNAHFRLDRPVPMPGGGAILGVIGGTAQWIFARGDIASVTVSAAGTLAERPAAEIADLLWSDVSQALDYRPADAPPCRIVKEKRATFAQVPAALPLRPGGRDPPAQPLPRRRLDRDRAARHHRGGGPLRRHGGPARASRARRRVMGRGAPPATPKIGRRAKACDLSRQ